MSDSTLAPPALETRRLRLRAPRDEDVAPLFAIQGDADAMRFTFRADDAGATRRHLRTWERSRATHGHAPWTVEAKDDGAVIGWGGLGRDPDDARWGPEVVYFLARDRWGRGLATELVEAALHLAFEELGLPEVGAFVRPENAASRRVLAKCGFRRMGHVPAMERDRYAIDRATWRAARAPDRRPRDAMSSHAGLRRFAIASMLHAAPEAVWRHAASPEGVNHELGPWLRMTFPRGVDDLAADGPGARGRCWLLLGGVLPVEYDDLSFAEVEPGRRFLERSTLLSQRAWEHERVVEPAPGGARLTDRIAFAPRLRALGPAHALVFRAVFRWRHHRLRRRFGGRPAEPA